SVHVPAVGAGGMDVKVGQFPSPMSAESIDASQNALYSHSYVFNFGVPFVHTGVLGVTHVNEVLDFYLGLDTGVNAWLGGGGLANDTVPHGQTGFGLSLLDGNLTVLALTHIGPENPKSTFGPAANSALRYLNDVTIVWKVLDKLTLTTDLNYIHDDGLKASGGGAAQYVAYTIDDIFTLIGRGEIWRDGSGAFVASFQMPFDFINAERGLPTSPGGVVGGGGTTYGALTLGVNIKPPVPKAIEGFVIRPELRFDDSLNGTKPFNTGKSGHQVTLAADFILPF
ncbi:MAG: outer membrane beta-barrel protein, partial [Alphaproteobacteria bacterium]